MLGHGPKTPAAGSPAGTSADIPASVARGAPVRPGPDTVQTSGSVDVSAKGTGAIAAARDANFNATAPNARVSVQAFSVPLLNVSVVSESGPLEREPVTGPEFEAWLAAERARLERPQPEPDPDPGELDLAGPYRDFLLMHTKVANDAIRSLANMGMLEPEDTRTEEVFDAQLERHLACCREVLGERTDHLLKRHPGNELRLVLANHTETMFRDVEVIVRIYGVRHLDPDGPWPVLPDLRPWRVRRTTPLFEGIHSNYSLMPYALLPSTVRRRLPQIDVEGSTVHVVFPEVDLRPEEAIYLPGVHVVPLNEAQDSSCRIEWEATASNADRRNKGELSISTSASTVTAARLLKGADPGDSDS